MRKMIVSTYVSLDGVIDNPMWTAPYWGDDIAKFQLDDLLASDALLLGRESYVGFAEAWPGRTDEAGFADYINSMAKFVASTTLKTVEWTNSSLIKGDVAQAIAKMKQQPGKNILKYGGGGLMHLLLQHNLLDELHVLVFPLFVGSGAQLFQDGSAANLKLVESKPFSSGVMALIYQPEPKA